MKILGLSSRVCCLPPFSLLSVCLPNDHHLSSLLGCNHQSMAGYLLRSLPSCLVLVLAKTRPYDEPALLKPCSSIFAIFASRYPILSPSLPVMRSTAGGCSGSPADGAQASTLEGSGHHAVAPGKGHSCVRSLYGLTQLFVPIH